MPFHRHRHRRFAIAAFLVLLDSAVLADSLTIQGDNLQIKDSAGNTVYPVAPPPPPPPSPDQPTPPGPVTTLAPGANAQAVLNTVPAGGSLVIPAGTTVGALRCKAGVTIWADGVVNVTGNFDCSSLAGWTVRGKAPGQGFVFQGTRINATGAAGNWAVGNNVFTNPASNGFDGSAIQLNGARQGIVINNDFTGSQGNVLGMYNLDTITFDGNHFTNCRQPFSIQTGTDGGSGNNLVIRRNVFIGTTRAAMEVGPSATQRQVTKGLVVDSNWFDAFNYSPNTDNYSALLAISLVAQGASNTTVTNNFVRVGDAMRGHGAAIEFTGTGEAKNNVLWGWSFAGFTYQNGWSIHDNIQYQVNTQWFANGPYTGTFSNNQMVTAPPIVPPQPARVVW